MKRDISLSTLKSGILKAADNAIDLVNDASVLIENKRYIRSYTLSQLALEEVGKSSMLYGFYVDLQLDNRSDVSLSEFKKKFYSHKKKTIESNMIDIMLFKKKYPGYSGKSKKFKDYAMNSFRELKLMNNGYFDDLKNKSLYVSFEQDNFKSPSELFDIKTCRSFFRRSKEKVFFWEEWIKSTISIDEYYGVDKEGIVKLLKEK